MLQMSDTRPHLKQKKEKEKKKKSRGGKQKDKTNRRVTENARKGLQAAPRSSCPGISHLTKLRVGLISV